MTELKLNVLASLDDHRRPTSLPETPNSSSFELVERPPYREAEDEQAYEYVSRPFHADGTVVLPTFSQYQLLMTVQGVRIYGLIVDPGAARGVIGCDSLGEIKDQVLKPRWMLKYIAWATSNAKFSGISSDLQYSVGLVTFPIGLQGISNAVFSADVLGGHATHCPGLVPLRSLMRTSEFMHFAFSPTAMVCLEFEARRASVHSGSC